MRDSGHRDRSRETLPHGPA